MKGLRTHILDFEIFPTLNTKKIVFIDTSDYYEQPETPILKILSPGSTKYFIVNIEPSKVSHLNSDIIGYSSIVGSDCLLDLSDGIWEFSYSICPYQYFNKTKNVLRTSNIDNTIAEIYTKIDIADYDLFHAQCVKKELMDVYILIESAKANVEFGFLDKANKDFILAQKKVKKIVEKVNK